MIGRPIDAVGSRRVLSFVVAVLALVLGGIWLTAQPVLWLVLTALWGACGWASVPALQHLLVTRAEPDQAMPIIAFQMSAVYLGSAVGSALGSAALDAGLGAGALPGSAALVAVAALGLVTSTVRRASVAVPQSPFLN